MSLYPINNIKYIKSNQKSIKSEVMLKYVYIPTTMLNALLMTIRMYTLTLILNMSHLNKKYIKYEVMLNISNLNQKYIKFEVMLEYLYIPTTMLNALLLTKIQSLNILVEIKNILEPKIYQI